MNDAAVRTTSPAALDRLPAMLAPHPRLMKYYALSSLLFGPAFFIAIVPLYFRYRSLRYEVDAEGITMRWGVLFRREVSLTYARIQDIHLSSNVVERWLGLARIQVQTASGASAAEMVLEGLEHVDRMRDFLYARMRGGAARSADAARGGTAGPSEAGGAIGAGAPGTLAAPVRDGPAVLSRGDWDPQVAAALHDVAAELRALRQALAPARAGDDV